MDSFFSLLIFLLAMYFLFRALKYNWKRLKYYKQCEVTKAQVVQKSYKALTRESNLFDKTKLRFVNNMGKVIIYETSWLPGGSGAQQLHSDGVEIIYDPDNPSDIRQHNFLYIWFWPLFWLSVTFIFFMSMLHEISNNGAVDAVTNIVTKLV